MIRYYFIFILSVFLYSYSHAQKEPVNTKYFDPQPQNFMKQLNVLFKENQRDELEEVYKKLEAEFKANKISENQLGKMCDILNIMYARKMQVFPYYRDFIQAVTNVAKSGYDESFQDRWYSFTKGILENAKKGNNRDFNTFMDFSNDLFDKNALVADKSKNYIIDTKDLSFKYDNGKILVIVPETNLRGFFQLDTTLIEGTHGVYNIMDKQWSGTGGRVTWERVMIPANECFVALGSYKIDMTQSEYSVDSVRMTYPEYFPSPVLGRLTDKITKEKDFTTIRYPQFAAYNKSFLFDNKVAANVKLSGGFTIKGNDVVVGGEDGAPAVMQIYDPSGTKKLFAAQGYNCYFKRGNYVKMDRARISLYVGGDSITHPSSNFKYDVAKNEVNVLRDESGSGKARYRSGYHKMSFDTEMLVWKLDDDHIDLKMLVGQGKNAAKFISDNNFDQSTYNLARTAAATTSPLNILMSLSKEGTEPVSLDNFIASFGPSFSASSVLPEVFLLEKDGFVSYTPSNKMIRVNRDLVEFYQKANSKKIDYDLIRFSSYGEKRIGKLNIKDKKIEINRVPKLRFNDSSFVYGYPSDSSPVELSDARKLKFNGKVLAGRLDVYGQDFKFNYDSFQLKSDKMDKVKINIPDKIDPATGEELLKPLKSQLEKVDGMIQINAKFNKSGKETALQYPKMTTYKPSYIYYDHPNIFNGKYHRDDFYFEASPFAKDSLNKFDHEALNYDGRLVSANIFDPFKEKARIQPDLSLGFVTKTPGSIRNYQTKGKFDGTISLSNNGLVGKGEISHLTASLQSDSILYFPEYTMFLAKKIEMSEQTTGSEFPQMTADSAFVGWMPYRDTMLIRSSRKHPFDMYNQSTKMHGLLTIEPKGMSGSGFLDFPEAKISSEDMRFRSTIMTADTSSMEIKSLGNKITFKTPNVRTRMDFAQKIGDFKSNDKDISTEFAYNQYKADINEFRWDMVKKILTFKSAENSQGMRFTSLHPNQDSLFLYCKTAEYNLITSIIKMDGVEEIRIADSKVIPDNGKVNIFPEAKMETLVNATVEGDTINGYHSFTKATLDIHGKNDMLGHGEYTLKIGEKDYPIKLQSIKTQKVEIPLEKKTKNTPRQYTIEGTGKVEKSENLKIYRNVDYHGKVHIHMNRKLPHFEGYQRIEFMNPPYKTPWFAVNNEINVSELEMYRKELESESAKQLYTGFLIDRGQNLGIYTSLMSAKTSDKDDIGFDARGMIKHNIMTNSYEFGDSNRILQGTAKGNRMIYDDSSGTIVADGLLNPSLKIGGIPVVMAGNIENEIAQKTYKFMGALGMNLTLNPQVMNSIVNFLATEWDVNKDIQYNKRETKNAFAELFHEKDIAQFTKDIEQNLTITTPPKYAAYNFVFTDLVMEWDPQDMVFRSRPEFGISMAGTRPINKLSQGSFIELGYGENFDYLNIFIQAKNKEYLFITYSDGQLGILTSNDAVNNSINVIEPKKRIVKKSDKEYYQYTVAGTYEADAFKKRMGKGGKYSNEDKRTNNDMPDINEKDVRNAETEDGKSPELEKLEAEESAQDSTENALRQKYATEESAEDARLEAERKANAEKKPELKESETEDKEAPNPTQEASPSTPKETPAEKPTETPTPPTNETPTEEELETPEKRETPTESPEEKKEAAPEKKEEGKSLFDSYF